MKPRNYIFLILSILWMGVIFSRSAQPATDSAKESGQLVSILGEIFVPGFDEWDDGAKQEFVERYDHPVRKAAHMCEYALLGMLLTGALYKTGGRRQKNFPIAPLGIAVLYAISDETHQLFVPGRSGEVLDVCIDSCGALIGVLLAALAFGILDKHRQTLQ